MYAVLSYNGSDWLNYKHNRYNLCVRHLQVLVKSYGQHTYLSKTMKYSRPEFYANATLLYPVLSFKHHILMYLDEYLIKLAFLRGKIGHKNTPPPKVIICNIFQIYFVRCTECQVLIGPRREKTCLWGFRQSEFQNSLLSYRD